MAKMMTKCPRCGYTVRTVQEEAREQGVSDETVRNWIRAGRYRGKLLEEPLPGGQFRYLIVVNEGKNGGRQEKAPRGTKP